MNLNKNLIVVLGLALLVGGFFFLRQGDLKNNSNGESLKKTSIDSKETVKLSTAREAWEKIKPKADEWSSNYKIARISDIDTPSYQRIDGVSLGWKFYLEECQEYFTGTRSDLCKKGKTRNFYYQADDLVGRNAGVSADEESPITSGRKMFLAQDWQIDSDKAQDLAREVVGRERNENEEFRMEAVVIEGEPYWKVIRQCWTRGNRDQCDSSGGYSAYIDIKTGQAVSEKP